MTQSASCSFGFGLLAFVVAACGPPCEPGSVSVLGPRYFVVEEGTAETDLLVRAGSCRPDQLQLETGRVGVSAQVAQKDTRVAEASLVARASFRDAPLGHSRVSIVVSGHDRFFDVSMARAFRAQRGIRLGFLCQAFVEREGRLFCNELSGSTESVVELSGGVVLQRWPGVVAEGGPGSSALYRITDSTVRVLVGPGAGASMSLERPIRAVSGEPTHLFVATDNHLSVVDLLSSRLLDEVELPSDERVVRIASSGPRVTVQTLRTTLPYRKVLHRFEGDSRLSKRAEPVETASAGGLNFQGYAWQCRGDELELIDTLGEFGATKLSLLPGACVEGADNPLLVAGKEGGSVFCPLGELRDGKFLGVQAFGGADRSACDRLRVYSFGPGSTLAAELADISVAE